MRSRLGHATAAKTLDTYSHLWPDSDDTTRTAVNSGLGKINAAAALCGSKEDHERIRAGHRPGADELACKPNHGLILD